jgi:hypothetical protein
LVGDNSVNGLCEGLDRWLVIRFNRRFILGNGYEGVRRATLGVLSNVALMVLVESVEIVPLGRDSSDVVGANSVPIGCGRGFSGDDLTAAVLSGEPDVAASCSCF